MCDDIYRSAISPEMWETLPGRLAAVAGGGSWALQLVRPGTPWRSAVHGVGFDPDLLALYPDRYAAQNPWLSGLMRMPALQLIRDSQILDPEELLQSEFYADFLRPQGDIHRACGMVLLRGECGGLIASCNYAPRHAESIGAAAGRILAMVGPHLRRAFELTQLFERNIICASARIMDGTAGPHACLALDSRSRLVACDTRGEALLSAGKALRLGRDRRLRFLDDAANAALDAGLGLGGHAGHGFVVPDGPAGRMLARLAPLPRPRAIAPIEIALAPERAVAALILTTPSRGGGMADEDLQALFDLTPAESMVLRQLCAGLSTSEVAALRGVSQNTVRNQICSLFDKTGTRRQAELVALVARLGT
ncbi:helix-turn-helix transcriptional regulator [Limimaricola litoreus]|uniref:Helix-turn-helix transcriptional regulator n=1 Tax=Limimaricola litoreus TaxID=2955316 RepID=A0A9X2JN61_9RHOB|nr:helix-turn-helix transcriptional regulator [Limimaricola litoreus]MCP1168327.1 helix-turn-helix transcriptional regulator [Limimaricola litoreus]